MFSERKPEKHKIWEEDGRPLSSHIKWENTMNDTVNNDAASIFLVTYKSYLTAPVIPSAKLFCKQKNTMAVGMVQINTPNISIP